MSNFLPVVKLEFINDKQVPAVTSQQLAEAFGKQHAHQLPRPEGRGLRADF